jgi:thiol:disulfide interchange protein DsbD
MRIWNLILALPLLVGATAPAGAVSDSADAPHVHVELKVLPQALAAGKPSQAGIFFKIEAGWHVYWQNAGDAGEPPHIRWTLPDGITAGPLEFPAPRRLPLGPLMDFGYEGEVLFPLTLNVAQSTKTGPAVLHAKVDWLVCSDRCIPGKAELEINRSVSDTASAPGPDAGLFKEAASRLPKPPPAGFGATFAPAANGFRLAVTTGRREAEAAFFPSDQEVIDNPAPQKVTPTATGLILDLKKDANLKEQPAHLQGVLELSGGRNYAIAAMPGAVSGQPSATPATPSATAPAPSNATTNEAAPATAPVVPAAAPAVTPPATATHPFTFADLLRSVGLAFLGGLLLNLMPCVFPVLFLKGLSLVQSGHDDLRKLRGHGVVYTLGILASFWALVSALLLLRAAGSRIGWGFQFQSPVVLALMAGLLFFLGLSLAGQFEIGLTLTSAGGSLAQKQGYAGSFFTGVLAVVVATPCTAPFMGAAVGYALQQSAVVSFAVFTALALGLAAPYVALTLQPAWARLLPRPGAWMEVLRQAVSVPIFGTVIWLVWVVAQAYGASVLAALLTGFLLLAIAGWFLGRWPTKRWATVTGGLIVLSAIGLTVFLVRTLEVPRFDPDKDKVLTLRIRPESVWQGNVWHDWTPENFARAQASGQPVFVDFTASWCLSCQVNERVALNQPEVEAAFDAAHVIRMRADWTREDDAITQTLASLGRSGVPAYALYIPGQAQPQLLPEALTPGIVIDALDKIPRGAPQTAAAASK